MSSQHPLDLANKEDEGIHILTKGTSLKNLLCHGIGLEHHCQSKIATILVSGYQAILPILLLNVAM